MKVDEEGISCKENLHSPALVSRRGIGEYPPLSAPFGPGSSSPTGKAVCGIEALLVYTNT
ncbi:MAG: hypothetical protein WC502_10320 [Methanolinea sp.]